MTFENDCCGFCIVVSPTLSMGNVYDVESVHKRVLKDMPEVKWVFEKSSLNDGELILCFEAILDTKGEICENIYYWELEEALEDAPVFGPCSRVPEIEKHRFDFHLPLRMRYIPKNGGVINLNGSSFKVVSWCEDRHKENHYIVYLPERIVFCYNRCKSTETKN